MVHISHLILPVTIAVSLFLIGIVGLFRFKKRLNYSRSLVLILGAYGLMISEIFIVLYSVSHIHSISRFHFHYSRFTQHEYFSKDNPISIPSILILSIGLSLIVFLISFGISQIILRILLKTLCNKSNSELSRKLKLQFDWLPDDYQLIVLDDNRFHAFTFTILKWNKYFSAENWIFISLGLYEILDEDELEMVIAHEYSHTYESDTRYSHLVYTISNIIFFDPMLRIIKKLMHENHEVNADMHAVSIIRKPLALAGALFKTINQKSKIVKPSIINGLFSKGNKLIIKRINLLIDYAEKNNFSV